MRDIYHQGDSDETRKQIMEHRIGGVERFAKTGKKGVKVSGRTGSPDFVDAYDAVEKEAKLLAELDHPNIVKVNDLRISQDEQEITMVEPLLPGETLDKVAKKLGKGIQALGTKIEIMKQVAKALDYCHSQGIVYADMKMQSVMVELDPTESGVNGVKQATLIDFGQSIDLNKPHPLDGRHFNERYGAIEQHLSRRSGGTVDMVRNPWVDYQSFGTVMYEFFTGEHPTRWGSYNPSLMERPDSYNLTKVPKEVRPLMEKILSCDPKERQQVGTLAEFVNQVSLAYEESQRNSLLGKIRRQIFK